MAKTFVITGVKELDAKLASFEPKLRTKIMRSATREAAKYVAADARRLAPHDTGELEKSIKVRARPKRESFIDSSGRKRSGSYKNSVGHGITGGTPFAEGLPFYSKFIELGWKYLPDGDPFLRPALYGNARRVKLMFARRIREGIAKIGRER